MPRIQVTIEETQANLSRFVEDVAAGRREIVITRRGHPVARLVPMQSTRLERKPGVLKGKIRISADFDAPLPDHVW